MSEISEKQLEANKQNAQLSTGAKTEEGKAISKLNALKHGLLSEEVLLEGEDEENLIELGKKLRLEYKPVTEIELVLVDRITANIWRLKRALKVEKQMMEYHKFYRDSSTYVDFNLVKPNPQYEEAQEKRKKIVNMVVNEDLEKIIRYETTIERSFFRALHELQRLQAVRLGEKVTAPLAIDVNVNKET